VKIFSQPIRVLHTIDSLLPGGAERMLVELVNSSDQSIVATSVCVTRQDLTLKSKIRPEIPVYCLKRKFTWDWVAFKYFAKIIHQDKIQIIHVHGYSSFRFAFTVRTLFHLPVAILVHAHSGDAPDPITSMLGRTGMDYFVGVSADPCRWAKEKIHLSENKITLMGNSIDPGPYREAIPVDLKSVFSNKLAQIGIVIANVRPVKDFYTLFLALSLSKYKSLIGILVAGSTAQKDYFENCKKQLIELELQDQVKFLGSRDDIPQLLASVDFGLLSSERETGPVALLEYLAAGLPFVVTQVGQVCRLVSQAGIPGCVPIKEPQAFARALDILIEASPTERFTRVERGHRLFEEKFNIHQQSARLSAIYQQMAS
jgi:glycosyltransferase involved in cell wall biosynthesis